MNKKELLSQIQSEIALEKYDFEVRRDIAFMTARAKNNTLTKAEFYKTYKETAAKKPNLQQRYIQKLIEQSNFKNSAPKTFTDKLNINDTYKRIYAALQSYCDKFPDVAKQNIVLSGGTGTGKTYAAQIIANNLLSKGFAVLYVTAFGLIERFKKYVQTFGDETETDALFDCDLLIIDDLGTEPAIRNISAEYLYNVINERTTNKRPYLITTNLSPAALMERYDQRIASRLLSKETSVVIEMNCNDLRLKPAK